MVAGTDDNGSKKAHLLARSDRVVRAGKESDVLNKTLDLAWKNTAEHDERDESRYDVLHRGELESASVWLHEQKQAFPLVSQVY